MDLSSQFQLCNVLVDPLPKEIVEKVKKYKFISYKEATEIIKKRKSFKKVKNKKCWEGQPDLFTEVLKEENLEINLDEITSLDDSNDSQSSLLPDELFEVESYELKSTDSENDEDMKNEEDFNWKEKKKYADKICENFLKERKKFRKKMFTKSKGI